jgi:major intracellular serine protease
MSHEIHLIPFHVEEVFGQFSEIPQGVKMTQAPEIWHRSDKGKGVVVAVIDTGCDVEHPDLKDRIVGVKNFTDENQSDEFNVVDYSGHGTHVAGTIAATLNGQGVAGVAPEAGLLIIKVLRKDPVTGSYSGKYEWIIKAIDHAIVQKVDIISMSLGGANDPGLHQAVQRAVKEQILVVCAAGNDGDGRHDTDEFSYPAGYNEVISVGAIDFEGRSAYFTNSNNGIDIVAPGMDILSTYPGEKYVKMSGTSMSAPHVSGALALLINLGKSEFQRKLTEPELYAQLIKRTMPLGYSKSLEGNGQLALALPDKLADICMPVNMLPSQSYPA